MRRRDRTQRLMPSSIPEKKGGFLLRSGNRHPEVFILANPKRRRREIAEQTTNFFLGDWPPVVMNKTLLRYR